MNSNRKIRVLIVDDSVMFREIILRGLSSDPDIEVVGVATDAYMARDKITELLPDVLTLDIEMPKISGIEFLKQLLPQYPMPVVVVSGVNDAIFDALNAGAVDFVGKPDYSKRENMKSFISELILKIKIASIVKVENKIKKLPKVSLPVSGSVKNDSIIIAIGASTGGTEAILEVIKQLPEDTPAIVVVQHMPPVFTKMYADRLNKECIMEVREAKNGDRLIEGSVLIAPGGFQMKIIKDANGYNVKVYEGGKVNGHAPSVDVMFNSVAETAKNNAIGIILTGMGSDGAKGLLKMHDNGAYTIGQDEKSSVVYGMPMVAYNIGAVDKVSGLASISDEIFKYLKTKNNNNSLSFK